MSLLGETQEVVEVGELVGRKVTVYLRDFDDVLGVLHSISNHGILIKVDETGNYELYPWWQVKCIVHEIKKPIEKVMTKPESSEERIKIVGTPKSIIADLLPEDYVWDWYDEDEGDISIQDDEGEEVIRYINADKELVVYDEKDVELAKEIARKLKISEITTDY